MSMTIKVVGIDRLTRKFGKMTSQMSNILQQAIMKSGFEIERGSKSRAPVDTGMMRASIRVTPMRLKAEIGPHVDYAIYVHEGTPFMKKRPFMEWGLRTAKPAIKGHFNKARNLLIGL